MYSKDRQSSMQKFETISQIFFILLKILENCHFRLLKVFPSLRQDWLWIQLIKARSWIQLTKARSIVVPAN